MPTCSWRLLLVACCLAASPAVPRAEEPAGPRRLALVLFEKGSPDRKLIDDFLSALSVIDLHNDSLSIIGRRELDKQLGVAHVNAVVACGADLRCIAAIGDKADATHVLFGRAAAEPGAVGIQWLLVNVKGAGIVGKLRVKLTDAASADAAATQLSRELLGVAVAPPEPVAEPAPAAPPAAVAAATDPPAAPGPRSSWSAPAVIGSAALALGAISMGAGVLESRDGDGARADLLLAAGGALALGGAAVWTFDWIRLSPVVSVSPSGGSAGVAGSW
jgi:hypothetical protein